MFYFFVLLKQNTIDMEYGQARGLAQSMDYSSRINDERFFQNQLERAKAQNVAKLSAFEDDLNYMNAANSFDRNLINGEAKKTINEIVDVVKSNPNWETDPYSRRLINEKKRYLKSNEHVIRGMASDNAYKEYVGDMQNVAKNPNMYDTEAYQDVQNQWNNYLKYGHQEGADAVTKFGPQNFLYKKPADFVNINEEGLGIGNKVKARKYKDLGRGGYQELVDENALNAAAMDLLNRRGRQIKVTLNTDDKNAQLEYAKELIKQGIDLKMKMPEYSPNHALEVEKWKAKRADAVQQGKNIDAYDFDIKSSKASKISPDALTEMLGSAPEAKIYNKDGSFVKMSEGRKFIPTGNYQQANTVGKDSGGKFHVTSPKTIGVAHGYVEYNGADLDASGFLDDHKMADQIIKKTRTNAKGKEEPYYLVPSQVEFDPNNEGFRFKYNNYQGLTNKQITELNPIQNQEIPTGSTQDFINAGWDNNQIQQAKQQGLIKVL